MPISLAPYNLIQHFPTHPVTHHLSIFPNPFISLPTPPCNPLPSCPMHITTFPPSIDFFHVVFCEFGAENWHVISEAYSIFAMPRFIIFQEWWDFWCKEGVFYKLRSVELEAVVGTLPPDDTWHAFLWWHVTRISIQISSIRISPKETHGALPLSGHPQGEAHDTCKHHIRTTTISHPDDRHILSGYVCPDRWLK